jgi:threonyl-tRNA synthetase
MPGRLGAEYVAEDNSRKVPVMLHRAILGSLERWIGMLIEHYAGAMPVWLAPVQVAVASITDDQAEYARSVADRLREAGVRVVEDLRGEKINYKIRELSLQKIPYIVVVGDKERQNDTVSVRARGNRNLGVMPVADFISKVVTEDRERVNGDQQ